MRRPRCRRAYSDAIDGLEPGPLAGSCGTAVHLGTQVVAADVSSDPRWEPFRELAVEHDIGACWSSPIRSQSRIVGTFAVYDRQPHEPDERERELVRRFTHLASIAVAHDGAASEREARHVAELARQSAERANHAKSQFVTSLSHELRTPLQSITGFTESLKTLDLSPERRRQALDGISHASAHILSIVDDVLDLARVEAGAMPIALEPVDAAEVAAATRGAHPTTGRRAWNRRGMRRSTRRGHRGPAPAATGPAEPRVECAPLLDLRHGRHDPNRGRHRSASRRRHGST